MLALYNSRTITRSRLSGFAVLGCAVFIAVALILFASVQTTCAAQVTLSWDANSEPDLAGYRVHYGTASRTYGNTLDVGMKTNFAVTGLQEGVTYYFAATAYDIYGNSSDYSQEVAAVFSHLNILNLTTNYYNDILDRPPEPGGAEGWTAEVERVMALGIDVKEGFIALGKFFFNSDEYLVKRKTNTAFVVDLYQAFLNRTPGLSEVKYWVGYLTQGLSRGLTLNCFTHTAEFNQYMDGIFGAGTKRPEPNLVNDFYRGFLNRLPDTVGFNSYLALMRTAQCSGAQQVRDLSSQIALGFLRSPEYKLRNRTNTQFVEDLYTGILRRGAVPEEINYWVNILNSGTYNREQELVLFTSSDEFQLKVQEVIEAGCLSS
jgi:hypothetical protein